MDYGGNENPIIGLMIVSTLIISGLSFVYFMTR